MFATVALLMVAAFVSATILLSFRFPGLTYRLLERLRGAVLSPEDRAILDPRDDERRSILCLRLWLIIGVLLFVAFGLRDGAMIRNQPGSIGTVVAYSFLSMGGSALIIFSLLAYSRFLPDRKILSTLSRCGFRGLWVSGLNPSSPELLDEIESRLRTASHVAIQDVTGFELLGKGKAQADGRGTLLDLVERAPGVPVSILLLNPNCRDVDPDRRRATIFQTTLSEMHITALTYIRRLRQTLKTVQRLNASRAAEARIQVRFYSEKPTVRAIIFDDSMLVSPWIPQEDNEPRKVTFFDVGPSPGAPSFFESFRRDYNRIWIGAARKINLPEGSSPDLRNAVTGPAALAVR